MVPDREPDAGVAHPVERHLAKVEVASSSLVTRSIFLWYRGQVVRQRSAKPLFPSSNLGGASKKTKKGTEKLYYQCLLYIIFVLLYLIFHQFLH